MAQGPGNRIGSLSAGSPGVVIAGTENYQTTAAQLCSDISYPLRSLPPQSYITVTGGVQQPSQGWGKVGGCISTGQLEGGEH